MRGATRIAIRPAMTNQVDDTSTSAPARVPIRKVPGGRGAGDDGGSDTIPIYLPATCLPLVGGPPYARRHERGRDPAGAGLALAQPGRGLPELSADVPVPHRRPA